VLPSGAGKTTHAKMVVGDRFQKGESTDQLRILRIHPQKILRREDGAKHSGVSSWLKENEESRMIGIGGQ